MVIGLTGGIGSGKTTIALFFSEFKTVAIYNADTEAKKLMTTSKSLKKEIVTAFGKEAYLGNHLNKALIAGIVFNDKSKLQTLNSIVHPAVKKHFQDFIKQNNSKDYILYENAILFESKSNLNCNEIITVSAPLHTRIERTILRDNTTKAQVEQRIQNQCSETKKELQSNYVINNLDLESARNQVVTIHNILTLRRTLI